MVGQNATTVKVTNNHTLIRAKTEDIWKKLNNGSGNINDADADNLKAFINMKYKGNLRKITNKGKRVYFTAVGFKKNENDTLLDRVATDIKEGKWEGFLNEYNQLFKSNQLKKILDEFENTTYGAAVQHEASGSGTGQDNAVITGAILNQANISNNQNTNGANVANLDSEFKDPKGPGLDRAHELVKQGEQPVDALKIAMREGAFQAQDIVQDVLGAQTLVTDEKMLQALEDIRTNTEYNARISQSSNLGQKFDKDRFDELKDYFQTEMAFVKAAIANIPTNKGFTDMRYMQQQNDIHTVHMVQQMDALSIFKNPYQRQLVKNTSLFNPEEIYHKYNDPAFYKPILRS